MYEEHECSPLLRAFKELSSYKESPMMQAQSAPVSFSTNSDHSTVPTAAQPTMADISCMPADQSDGEVTALSAAAAPMLESAASAAAPTAAELLLLDVLAAAAEDATAGGLRPAAAAAADRAAELPRLNACRSGQDSKATEGIRQKQQDNASYQTTCVKGQLQHNHCAANI
jgi:hypothetical protein